MATSRFIQFLKIHCLRYVAYYLLPYWVVLLGAGAASWFWAWIGILASILLCFGIESANRVADEAEDRINQPVRTAMCDAIGFGRLKLICTISWASLIGLMIVFAFYAQPAVVLMFAVVGVIPGFLYSYGIRFKSRRFLVLLIMTCPTSGSLLVGWSAAYGGAETLDWSTLVALVPLLVVTAVFCATLGTAKDITDVRGDEAVGYFSLWGLLMRQKATCTMLSMTASPFMIVALCVALGWLPSRYLLLLLMWPVSLLFVSWIRLSTQDRHRDAIREFMYHYWFLFAAVVMILYYPSAATLLSVSVLAVYWLLMTQFFHWSGGIRLQRVSAILELSGLRPAPILEIATVPAAVEPSTPVSNQASPA